MIRKFKLDDIKSIMEIWLSSNIQTHYFIDKNYWRENYNLVESALPNSIIYVYERDKIIQGFIGLNGEYIEGIFVDEKFRSQGIGKELIEYVKERKNTLYLKVYEKNNKAIDFYFRENFKVMSKEIDNNTKENELLMKWKK